MPLVHRRLWLAIGWGLVALVIYFSLTPQPPDMQVDQGDKLAHLLAYFSLAAWFGQIHGPRLPLVLALLALGAGLELAQGLSGYRDMSLADMLANSTGVGLGWLAARRWPRLLAGLERRRS